MHPHTFQIPRSGLFVIPPLKDNPRSFGAPFTNTTWNPLVSSNTTLTSIISRCFPKPLVQPDTLRFVPVHYKLGYEDDHPDTPPQLLNEQQARAYLKSRSNLPYATPYNLYVQDISRDTP